MRTNNCIGETEWLPQVGKSFFMTAPPLESGNLRVIETSPVITLEATEYGYLFSTENSIYKLELL